MFVSQSKSVKSFHEISWNFVGASDMLNCQWTVKSCTWLSVESKKDRSLLDSPVRNELWISMRFPFEINGCQIFPFFWVNVIFATKLKLFRRVCLIVTNGILSLVYPEMSLTRRTSRIQRDGGYQLSIPNTHTSREQLFERVVTNRFQLLSFLLQRTRVFVVTRVPLTVDVLVEIRWVSTALIR